MRKRNLMIRLTGILSVLLLIVLYLVLYLFPTVKSINRIKRDVKDINLQTEEFGEIESDLSFPDEKEKEYFQRAERDFKKRIAKIKGQAGLTKLKSNISDYFYKLAEQDGIANLKINSRPGEAGIKVGDNLKYRNIYLNFSGDLKNALNFINHLPYGDPYLTAGNISLSKENTVPSYSVVVKIYYFSGKAPAAGSQGGIDIETGLEFDFDSELLLDRVYHNFPEKYRRKELPPEFGALF